jgi:predicted NUDIX family NTP pyrophosphohydrolase
VKRSAGVLLWRRGGAGVEVLLAHPGGPLFVRKDDHHWSIPKGEHEAGESPREAAWREFEEETGHPVPAGEVVELGEARQRGGKVNTVYAVEGDLDPDACTSNDFSMLWHGRVQQFPEMDRYGWYDLDTARTKIFSSQLVFVDRLKEALDYTSTASRTPRWRSSTP